MTTRSPVLAIVLALLVAEAVTAMGRLPPTALAPAPPGTEGFTCALVARSQGGSTVLEGRVAARSAMQAAYALRVRGPGVAIDQSGETPVGAGATVVLGEATVTGRPADLDARLEVTVGGRTTRCPLRAS